MHQVPIKITSDPTNPENNGKRMTLQLSDDKYKQLLDRFQEPTDVYQFEIHGQDQLEPVYDIPKTQANPINQSFKNLPKDRVASRRAKRAFGKKSKLRNRL